MDPWQAPSQPGWGPPPATSHYGPPQYPGGPFGSYLPNPAPQPSANGGTAITAAVLSFLGSAAHGVAVIWSVVAVGSPLVKSAGISTGFFVFVGLASFAVAVGLLVGGIMLLRRQLAGRIVVAAACVIAILITIVSFVFAQDLSHKYGLTGITSGVLSFLLHLVMPGVTIGLALATPTQRWCLAGRPRMPLPPLPPTTTW